MRRGLEQFLRRMSITDQPPPSDRATQLEELLARERQQAAVAKLGQRALAGLPLLSLMDEAVGELVRTLDVQYAKVLELLPDGDAFLLRSGVGWQEGLVGRATVAAGRDSQSGYTLLAQEPVVVADLRAETRFSGPPLLLEHGVVSGMSVIIGGVNNPFGVLGVHTTHPRTFSQDDVHFLQAVANILAMAVDRRAMEEELRRSRDQLHVILSSVADGITVQDASGRLIYANSAASRIIGYPSEEELLAAPIAEVMSRFQLMDEAGRPLPLEELPGRKALQGQESPDTTLRFRVVESGEERWALVKSRPIFDASGRAVQAVNLFQDITRRKWAEERERFLAESTALLASSLDYETTLSKVAHLAVPRLADWCSVHVVEADGQVRSVAVTHVDPTKLEFARRMGERNPVDPDAQYGLARVLRTGQPELHPEISDSMLEEVARDPEHLEILRALGMKSAMLVPMVARGRTLGAITFVSAESGIRYTEEDLALAKHLARRSALAVDNARLYGEAAEAVRMRNEFLFTVSHDLKNPITAIKGMAQLLRRQVERLEVAGSDTLVVGLDRLDSAATRLTRQVDELLDMAQLQSGQSLELQCQRVDLVHLIREIAAGYQDSPRHPVRIEARVEELIGSWDPVRLERVLGNLIANAIKFSPEGGEVVLTISPEERDGESWAAVAVRDHGIGIPAPDLPHIFKGFYRAGNASKRIAGTGLGLANARQIAQMHGGDLAVESVEGLGSEFRLMLPLEPPACRSEAGSMDTGSLGAA